MPPTTRAKFRCNRVEVAYAGDQYDAEAKQYVEPREPILYPTVVLNPVYEPDESDHENHRFWTASPSGELRMQINNPAGAEVFEPGKLYYLDITAAES